MEVVSESNFKNIVASLTNKAYLSFDTETTGLSPYKGDRLFSVILADEENEYYFNFQDYGGEVEILPNSCIKDLSPIFQTPKLLFAHNAKFDLHMLGVDGVEISADVWCTLTGARVLYNNHMQYSLAACAERAGLSSKSDAVEEYIENHKLWDWINIPDKKTRIKNKHYELVPPNIMVPYGKLDARITFDLGMKQLKELTELDSSRPKVFPSPLQVMHLEMEVTKAAYQMEKVGIRLDRKYCVDASLSYEAILKRNKDKFEEITGAPYVDSAKTFSQVFHNFGYAPPKTKLGNPCFDEASLKACGNEVSDLILECREAEKKSSTYFRSYLYHATDNDTIHASMWQGGTATGRVSYSDPNLQNIPKEDEGHFLVRKAFVPRPGYCHVSIDYDQMEFRLMLDIAGEMALINLIKEGHDPHQATADLCYIPRKAAKTLNFGLLYGMGLKKLAATLGVVFEEAATFRAKYFSGLPQVRKFLKLAKVSAERYGNVFNWYGRIYQYDTPEHKRFSYKAPNSIIQGGCADIMKLALVRCAKFLEPYKSNMLVQIHDELLFEIHESELHLVDELVKIMENVYPYRHLPMSCSVTHSWKSFGELVDGKPCQESKAC